MHECDSNSPLYALMKLEATSKTGTFVVMNDLCWQVLAIVRQFADLEPHEHVVFGHDVGRSAARQKSNGRSSREILKG